MGYLLGYILSLLLAFSTASKWWLGNGRDSGRTAYIPETVGNGLRAFEPMWSLKSTGSRITGASISVYGDNIYFASTSAKLHVADRISGKLVHFKNETEFTSMWIDEQSDLLFQLSQTFNYSIMPAMRSPVLKAYDPKTLQLRWHTEINDYFVSSPTTGVSGRNAMFIQNKADTYAFDKTNGRILFRCRSESQPAIVNERLFQIDGTLMEFSATNGSLLWRSPENMDFYGNYPVISGDLVITRQIEPVWESRPHYFLPDYNVEHIVAFDTTQTRKIRWTSDASCNVSSPSYGAEPITDGDTVFWACGEPYGFKIYAIRNGTTVRTYLCGDLCQYEIKISVLVTNDYLFAMTQRVLLAFDKITTKIVATLDLSSGDIMAYHDKVIYVAQGGGADLVAYRLVLTKF